MNGAEPFSVKAVRLWLAVYTRGLPTEARERRCLELESDLWEHLHDADETDAARAVLGRFLRGIPADVRWRYRTLLESRGARQRSKEMTTSLRSNWWVILTAMLGVVPLGISLAMFAGGVGGGGALRLIGVAPAVLTAALLIGGLIRRQTDLVNGSQLILTGAALTLMGGLEFIPVGIIVLVSGFWTGNLQLSEPADAPDLHPVRAHQITMTGYWYLWLGAAAVLFRGDPRRTPSHHSPPHEAGLTFRRHKPRKRPSPRHDAGATTLVVDRVRSTDGLRDACAGGTESGVRSRQRLGEVVGSRGPLPAIS